MPDVNYFGVGPQTFGTDITWTASNTQALFGYGGSYDAGVLWDDPADPLAGTNYAAVQMIFSFGTPIAAFLGQMQWCCTSGAVTLSAFDSSNRLLDEVNLADGSHTSGSFYGFQEGSADISRIVFYNGGIAVRDVSILASPVPEPSTWAMLILGLAGLSFLAYRRTQARSWLQ